MTCPFCDKTVSGDDMMQGICPHCKKVIDATTVRRVKASDEKAGSAGGTADRTEQSTTGAQSSRRYQYANSPNAGAGNDEGTTQKGEETGFFGSLGILFDFSFNRYFTIAYVQFAYGAAMVFSALCGLAVLILVIERTQDVTSFAVKIGWTFAGTALGVAVFLLLLILSRLSCEILIVFFKIGEDIHKLTRSVEE